MKLRIENLEKSYGRNAVLRGASHTFESGKIYGILGRNGSGKTTMFHCLAGGLRFEGGTVTLEPGDGAPRPARYDDVGFVFAEPHLPEFMTGYEFIRYFTDIHRHKIGGGIDIGEKLAFVGLQGAEAHRLIRHCSRGVQHKLQFLAFLLLRPPVILLDEPLTSFDVVAALQFKGMLKSLKGEHIIILSTHILQLAQDLCDEVVILHEGRLTAMDAGKMRGGDFEGQVMEALTGGGVRDA